MRRDRARGSEENPTFDALSHAILDRLDVGVCIFRRGDSGAWDQLVVEWTNPTAARLLGRDHGEAWGLPLAEVAPELVGTEVHRRALTMPGDSGVRRLGVTELEVGDRGLARFEVTALSLDDGRFAAIFQQESAGEGESASPRFLLRRLFETIDEAVFVIEPTDRRILLCNAAVERIFGYRPEELIGRSTEILYPTAEEHRHFGDISEPSLDKDGSFHTEVRMRHRSGRLIEAEVSVYPLREEQGWREGAVSVVRDRTELRRQTAERERSERFFRRIVEMTSDGIVLVDRKGVVRFANERFCRNLGHSVRELEGRELVALVHEGDRSDLWSCLKLETDDEERCDLRLEHADGSVRWVDFHAVVLEGNDPDGEILVSCNDLTERKLAEEERRRLLTDLEERVKELRVIHETVRLLEERLPLEELLEKLAQLLPPGWLEPDRTEARICLGEVEVATSSPVPERAPRLRAPLLTKEEKGFVEVFLTGDEPFPAGASGFLDEERSLLVSFAELLQSHLERRFSERAVELGRERLELALDVNDLGIWDWRPDGIVVDERCRKTLNLEGRRLPEGGWLVDREAWLDRVHSDDVDAAAREWRGIQQSGRLGLPLRLEYRYRPRPGEEIWLDVRGRVVEDSPDGATSRAVGTLRDVTPQKEGERDRETLEVQLLQAQKMESVGRLAGGVAHDFNNVLTAILGYADLLGSELPAGSAERDDLEEIRKAAERAARLTAQLLAFSRQQILQPVALDPNDVVGSTLKMLSRVLGEDVEIVTRLDPELWPVEIDPGGMEQILMNLCVNARDAMPRGGKLTIATRNRVLDAEFVSDHLGSSPGPHVEISVTDTGEGMSPDVLARAFEPFFTTKVAGEGTGLGLSTVYGMIKQSGGYLILESRPEEGTVARVLLPRVHTEVEETEEEDREIALEGSETILLVEDEADLCRLVQRVLSGRGYRVLAAAGAEQAMDLARESGPIDLLLSDVVMPDKSGLELFRELNAVHPDIPVLYMSGYTDEAFRRYGLEELRGRIVRKPFTRDELLRHVRRILDREDSGPVPITRR